MYNNPYNFNPYMNQQPRFQPMEQSQVNNYQQPLQNNQGTLLGKAVDSIDVVKVMDIPLGNIGYFPLMDGSGIITKSWQPDGTTKIVEFRPIEQKKETIQYLTKQDLDNRLEELDLSKIEEIEKELKEIKQELKKKKGE